MKGRELTVTPRLPGPQHSLYAEVASLEAGSIARVLVAAGLAWLDTAMAPEYHSLGRVLEEAQAERRGLWALEEPQPPAADRRAGAVTPGR